MDYMIEDTRSSTACLPNIYGYVVDGPEPEQECTSIALAGTCDEE